MTWLVSLTHVPYRDRHPQFGFSSGECQPQLLPGQGQGSNFAVCLPRGTTGSRLGLAPCARLPRVPAGGTPAAAQSSLIPRSLPHMFTHPRSHTCTHTHYAPDNSSLIPVGCPTVQFNSDMTTQSEHRPHKLKGRSPKDCSHCKCQTQVGSLGSQHFCLT